MAAGKTLASLRDQLRLPRAQHLCIHLSVWEATLEVIRPRSERFNTQQTRFHTASASFNWRRAERFVDDLRAGSPPMTSAAFFFFFFTFRRSTWWCLWRLHSGPERGRQLRRMGLGVACGWGQRDKRQAESIKTDVMNVILLVIV